MAIIAIDWDGTLVDSSVKGVNPALLDGSREAIGAFREVGHKAVIFSANKPEWIQKWLNEWGVVVDHIYDQHGKLNADIFVDDKSYHKPYNDSWLTHTRAILDDARVARKDNRRWR